MHMAQTTSCYRMALASEGDKDAVEGKFYPWRPTRSYITEPLTYSTCTKIYKMREIVWDPRQITIYPPCCPGCFFKSRGGRSLSPRFKADTFPNVGQYGYYVMNADMYPEVFLWGIIFLGSEEFLTGSAWKSRYFDQKYKFQDQRLPPNSI